MKRLFSSFGIDLGIVLRRSSEINQYEDFYLWDITWIDEKQLTVLYFTLNQTFQNPFFFFLWSSNMAAHRRTFLFASVDANKTCQLEQSLWVLAKGHFDSVIFSLNAPHTAQSTSWKPNLLTARAKHNEILAQTKGASWRLLASDKRALIATWAVKQQIIFVRFVCERAQN